MAAIRGLDSASLSLKWLEEHSWDTCLDGFWRLRQVEKISFASLTHLFEKKAWETKGGA